MEKTTHESYKTELFAPIIKDAKGKYIAVLSDNSVDRDEEKVSRGCIEKLGKEGGYLAALCNHQNDVFMMVAEWIDRGAKEVGEYLALIAEPRFFVKSSPQARQIKGMLDEGAEIGVSIGAIVKDYDEVDGMRIFTELELVEASFVAVPSNRHGRAMAVAKSFEIKEVHKMDEQELQKKIDSAVDKKADELKVDFNKQLESKDVEIVKLKKEAEEAKESEEKTKEEADTATEEAKDNADDADKKLKETEKELEKSKKVAIDKQKFADVGNVGKDKKLSSEDINKAFEEGKLPIMEMM